MQRRQAHAGRVLHDQDVEPFEVLPATDQGPAAAFIGTVACFALPAVTVALTAPLVGAMLLVALVVIVAVAAVCDGRSASLAPAAMAAFSFDFFHVSPVRGLHPGTLLSCLALFATVAVVAGVVHPRPRMSSGPARSP